MSVPSRGGDAGARSHAESLSGVRGHMSSLPSSREKKLRDYLSEKLMLSLRQMFIILYVFINIIGSL